jgi:hypothetical protein
VTSCTQPWIVAWHVLVQANPICASVLDNRDFAFQLTPLTYLSYFALTCAIEFPFVYLAVSKSTKRISAAILWTLILNLATHPLICLVFVNQTRGRTFGEFTLAAEGFAFATEMLLISIAFHSRALPAAFWIFTANLASWTAGSFL